MKVYQLASGPAVEFWRGTTSTEKPRVGVLTLERRTAFLDAEVAERALVEDLTPELRLQLERVLKWRLAKMLALQRRAAAIRKKHSGGGCR